MTHAGHQAHQPGRYPAELAADATLRDGILVHVRPVRPDDGPALVRLHGRLSRDAIYFRYFSRRREVPMNQLEHFTHIDYRDHMGLVVERDGELVAHACYARSALPANADETRSSNKAEVAFEVQEDHWGKGIATLLLRKLADVARQNGIRQFSALVLPENHRMLEVFRDAGLPEKTHFESGLVCVALDLTEDRVDDTSGASERLSLPDWPDRDILEQLAEPDAYPADSSAAEGVDWIQTHISHVFLSAQRVYKFRKPVDLGFVHFETRAERTADCTLEITLNRRLAPDVYLGMAPLCSTGDRHWIGPLTETPDPDAGAPEYCVVMRRLPEGRDALSLLEKGTLSGEQLDRVARLISDFHERHSLGAPSPLTAEQWLSRCMKPNETNFQSLMKSTPDVRPEPLLLQLRDTARAFGAEHAKRFERRRRAGRAVDAHGDLHLQHIWFERDDSEPLIIDCLEFNEDLRKIDAAAEVAFPAMDLRYRGHPELAERFLRVYARESDDFDLYSVVDYFTSYRAGVRAKVAAIAAGDSQIDADQRARAATSVRRHLELAVASLENRPVGTLVMVGGVVGAGKSTLANALAEPLGGVVISSDRVRKRLAGLQAYQHRPSPIDTGLYTPEFSKQVYAGLLERAKAVVLSGRAAILDATFGRREERANAANWARALGARVHFVEARCSADVALDRLARRAAEGSDPSDAGPDFHAASVARFEAASGEESARVVHTDREGWRGSLHKLARDLRD